MAGILNLDFRKKEKIKEEAAFVVGARPEGAYAGRIYSLPAKDIVPNPLQPRSVFDEGALFALARSIQEYGMIQPITVRRLASVNGVSPPVFELVAGERRLRAALLLGMAEVPCVIADIDMKTSGEMAIIENLQREDLNFFEQAAALQKLIDVYAYTQEQAAAKLSVSQSYVANKLRLLKLSPEERKAVLRGGLTERHARALLRLPEGAERERALKAIIGKGMNVAEADKYVAKLLDPAPERSPERRRTLILKDIRLFLNSIDKAVGLVSQCGINIKSEKVDKGEYIEVCLIVPKTKEGAGAALRR